MHAMLKDTNLESLSNEQLIRLAEVVDAYLCKQPANGEPYHPDYRKNKQSFNLLVKQTVAFNRAMDSYFQSLSKKIPQLVKLDKVKADEISDMIDDGIFDEEAQELASIMHTAIAPIFKNGAASESAGSSVDGNDAPSQKFLRKYTVKLAGDVTKETKKRVTESIKTSLDLGEDRDELTARLTDIVDDDYRAEMIAQTESIRAYTQGRIAVGIDLGYEGKEWQWPGDSDCKICPALQELGPIAIDDDFDIGDDYGPYDGAPAHPWCQCRVKLVETLDEEDISASEELYRTIKAGWITKNGGHIYLPDDDNTMAVNSTGKTLGQIQEEHEAAAGLSLLTQLNNTLSKNDFEKASLVVEKINAAKDTDNIAKYKGMATHMLEQAKGAADREKAGVGPAIRTEREAIDFSKNSTIKETVYHGSNEEVQTAISKNGFTIDQEGEFGPGAYFATRENTAAGFGTHVTNAKLNVSNVKVVDSIHDIANEAMALGIDVKDLTNQYSRTYDAVKVVKDGYIAVFDPGKAVPFK